MTLLKCPTCHYHFPVNLKKHINRRERYCPQCRTPITVRSKISFGTNPKWLEQKQREAEIRERMKEKKRPSGTSHRISMQMPFVNIFLESLRMKKQLEKEAKKNEPA